MSERLISLKRMAKIQLQRRQMAEFVLERLNRQKSGIAAEREALFAMTEISHGLIQIFPGLLERHTGRLSEREKALDMAIETAHKAVLGCARQEKLAGKFCDEESRAAHRRAEKNDLDEALERLQSKVS